MSALASDCPSQRRFRRTLPGVRAFAALALAMLPLAAARAQVFANTSPITIPNVGAATPFPSTINVTGVTGGTLTDLRVRLKNVSHTYPADVGVLLVAPDGSSHQLIAPIPTSFGFPVNGITLTLSSDSSTPLPNPLVTGSFQTAGGNQVYAAPANTFPRVDLDTLLESPRNGTWQLFVQDFVGGDSGTIAGGWEIEFFDITQPLPSTRFTYQGRLEGGDADGFIDARFSLWDGQNSGNPINLLAGPVQINFIPVTGGLFTAAVDLGIPLPTDLQTFLQLEVRSSDGSTFETLSPRQPMTAAPLASVAAGLGSATALPGGNILTSGQQGIGFIGNNANVGIGTSTPGQRLDVRGSIALGNNGELRAPGGEENLRMIRGTISSGGSIGAGSGFSAVRTSTGEYTVTFATSFPGGPPNQPAVTVSALTTTPRVAYVSALTSGVVAISVRDLAGNPIDTNFSFIAIGPR